MNVHSSRSDSCPEVCRVPVSVQRPLPGPPRAQRTLRGAPVTVKSQRMRARNGDGSELLLDNGSLSSSSGAVVRDAGHWQHLCTPAGLIRVKQVNGNMKGERCAKTLSCLSWTCSNGFPLFNSDDVPAIDTDSDVDQPGEPLEADSGQRISDVDSESCHESPEPVPTTHVSPVEAPPFSAVVKSEHARSRWLSCAYGDARWRSGSSVATHARVSGVCF